MLFADKLGMPKKIKDLAESLDLEVTNHHDPEFDAKLCALIFGELTDKYPSYQELVRFELFDNLINALHFLLKHLHLVD